MIRPTNSPTEADAVWQLMVGMVWETRGARGEWRRKVSEISGLPFSRIRILWRLVDRKSVV